MRLLYIANNCPWTTWDKKIKDLKDWFNVNPEIQLDIKLIHTRFNNIPFKKMPSVDSAVPVNNPNWQGVDDTWYKENISPLAIGYDIVLFHLNLQQWPYNNSARGWRTGKENGPVQLQLASGEFEMLQWTNFPYLSANFQLSRHEILHALFDICDMFDLTHYFWNLGKLEYARDMIKVPKNYEIKMYARLINYLKTILIRTTMPEQTPSEVIFQKAKSLADKGIDASPNDLAPDDLACAESVSTVINSVFSAFPIVTGTSTLLGKLIGYSRPDGNWKEIDGPEPGAIIISATGTNTNPSVMPHGHTGICGENGVIYSNRSSSGTWDSYWNIDSWRKYYGIKGGYPVRFFKKIK